MPKKHLTFYAKYGILQAYSSEFPWSISPRNPYPRPYMILLLRLGVWGVVNLLEGYGNDNPGAKSQGIKQLMAGGGVALIGTTLVPLLSGLFG